MDDPEFASEDDSGDSSDGDAEDAEDAEDADSPAGDDDAAAPSQSMLTCV